MSRPIQCKTGIRSDGCKRLPPENVLLLAHARHWSTGRLDLRAQTVQQALRTLALLELGGQEGLVYQHRAVADAGDQESQDLLLAHRRGRGREPGLLLETQVAG